LSFRFNVPWLIKYNDDELISRVTVCVEIIVIASSLKVGIQVASTHEVPLVTSHVVSDDQLPEAFDLKFEFVVLFAVTLSE
jgi:hypothetical protein